MNSQCSRNEHTSSHTSMNTSIGSNHSCHGSNSNSRRRGRCARCSSQLAQRWRRASCQPATLPIIYLQSTEANGVMSPWLLYHLPQCRVSKSFALQHLAMELLQLCTPVTSCLPSYARPWPLSGVCLVFHRLIWEMQGLFCRRLRQTWLRNLLWCLI